MGTWANRRFAKNFCREVSHAVVNVLDPKLMASVFYQVGLSETYELRHKRWVLLLDRKLKPTYRHVATPRCLGIVPAPFGACTRYTGLIGQD